MQSMEAIMNVCCAEASLTRLDMSCCIFDENASQFLAQTLSQTNAIDTLILESIQMQRPRFRLCVNLGNVQVKKLVLSHTYIEEETFSEILESVSNNSYIKGLELNHAVIETSEHENSVVCDFLLRQNRRSPELVIGVHRNCVAMITEAMQLNTSLDSLVIDYIMSKTDLVTFAERLVNMRGLRKLAFEGMCSFSKEFFRALQESLERNTTLCTLSFGRITPYDPYAASYLPRIRYLLAINRVGRHRLMTVPAPVGLWARVLASSSNEPNGIYFVLTEKPDIVMRSGKRKRQGDEDNGGGG
jgi:hypothetical protein